MKIALPISAAGEFSPHYGAAERFAVYEVDLELRVVRRRIIVEPQASEPCEWPRFLRAAGAELILAGGMGQGARQHMAEHGIKVVAGVGAATPEAIVTGWLAGHLTVGANACDGSGHGRHAHAGDPHHDHGPCHCGH